LCLAGCFPAGHSEKPVKIYVKSYFELSHLVHLRQINTHIYEITP
jgi:hypothetical protein